MKVSAVVITRNEAKNIERCLTSLKFCDEIVVLDAQSNDSTCELARKFTSRVFSRPWTGYSEQKNEAITLADFDWILSLDADEEVPIELQQEILATLRAPACSAYSLPRRTIHSGKWIRYGGWYPNRLVRLFDRRMGKWEGTELHERWESVGKVGELRNDLIHYSFRNLSDQVLRNNHYSTLGARNLLNRGYHFSRISLLVKPAIKFLETYVIKRGFLDGLPGFMISISAAYSVFLKWAKLWEIERETSS